MGSDEASDTTVGWDFSLEILFTGAGVLDFHLTLFGSSFLGRDFGGSEVVVSSVRSLLNTVQLHQCIQFKIDNLLTICLGGGGLKGLLVHLERRIFTLTAERNWINYRREINKIFILYLGSRVRQREQGRRPSHALWAFLHR